MKRLATLLLSLALLVPTAHAAGDIREAMPRISISGGVGWCSSFQIKPGIYFTAAHCLNDGSVELNGKTVEVLLNDKLTDLGVFRSGTKFPKVVGLGNEPKVGDPVTFWGWGPIEDVPFGFTGNILSLSAVPVEGAAPAMIVNYPASAGMSGGPVIDKSGKAIGIISDRGGPMSDLRLISGSVPWTAVSDAYQRYIK